MRRNPIGRPPSMSLCASIGADWDVEWLPRKVLKDPTDDGLDRLPHMDWDGAMTAVRFVRLSGAEKFLVVLRRWNAVGTPPL